MFISTSLKHAGLVFDEIAVTDKQHAVKSKAKYKYKIYHTVLSLLWLQVGREEEQCLIYTEK